MNPFYLSLCGDESESSKLQEKVRDGLKPFRDYLSNSITAFKDKEVTCEWEALAQQQFIIKPKQNIYQVVPLTRIRVINPDKDWHRLNNADLDDDFEVDLDEPVTLGKGKKSQKIKVTDSRVRNSFYEIKIEHSEVITSVVWLGYTITLVPLSLTVRTTDILTVNEESYSIDTCNDLVVDLFGLLNEKKGTAKLDDVTVKFEVIKTFSDSNLPTHAKGEEANWLVISAKKPRYDCAKVEDITGRELKNLTVDSLFDSKGKPLIQSDWEVSLDSNKVTITAQNSNVTKLSHCSLCTHPDLEFDIKEENTKEQWIQLIEPKNNEDSGLSALDYFFSENAIILESNQNNNREAFHVIKSNSENKQLLLAKSKQTKHQSVLPTHKTIKAKVDISQLRKQQDAIAALTSVPHSKQHGLLNLFKDQTSKPWQHIESEPLQEDEWKILTDIRFKGCQEQREFVEKALATPDFAILDGPPGTGKTTSILELIVQLVRQGKKILLTASTHAAINNVLERIDSKQLTNEVFPLRIGDTHNAQGLEHYQFDSLVQSENTSKQILVDSANLICGTTIGIMRLFNDKEVNLPLYEPAFDVMIIDECSKTPFQEFLVPARYAAKHILVGDIRQLSPFTDREQIVANLENLILEPGRKGHASQMLDKNLQTACFLLEVLRGGQKSHQAYSNQLIKTVSPQEATALRAELATRVKVGEEYERILVIDTSNVDKYASNPIHLWDYSLCFIADNCLQKINGFVPADSIWLSDDWHTSDHAFSHQALFSNKQKLNSRGASINGTSEVASHFNKQLKEKSWAEEVCWRLERLYWLRLSHNFDNKTKNYKETIERLLPKSINCEGRVFQLQQVAFPSVLEALSGNGLQKRKQDISHTLNSGFTPVIKKQRHTTLSYQHRMHPDISKFPGRQFYNGESLKNGDAVYTDREWQYQGFKSHATWFDIPKNSKYAQVNQNKNKAEVDKILKELKQFCDWGEGRVNDEGQPYSVAILTFYKGQEAALRNELQKLPGNNKKYSQFQFKGLSIKLATVDYFQGQEADLVFLSMVNNYRDGFLDSPNRLNVAITRARYQLAIVGCHDYFENRDNVRSKSPTTELNNLAKALTKES
ncbi:hypothetical protein AMS58_03230 [Pseudoalteromonas porphyrae]|uniref:AAA+ ATPase domain-containing protein n=1 Tax=Pseudoalteromonas porphyrae TaxID=187330 RepID=A0A0N1MW01_9GAMM|nr:DEAD/DEAH box helicase [Pseudoalteromonas porphyrae]KPH64274.1 hypothetical protein ADS77_06195 [Pseudoalteromonas porphyrae]KPH96106.1 hypothetical protein AMS58_03230 [Pseudoalteromonas porphyrae]